MKKEKRAEFGAKKDPTLVTQNQKVTNFGNLEVNPVQTPNKW